MTEQSPEAEVQETETPTDSSSTATSVEERPVYGDISIEDLDTPEYSQEQFDDLMAMYDESFSGIKEGEIVKGRVVGTTPGEVLVDIGFKSEGAIPLKEFGDAPEAIEIGAEVEVFLENVEDLEGRVVLSKQKADFMRVWDSIKEAHDGGSTVNGRLTRRIKGGIVVDLLGVEAFLPGSQIDIRQVKNFDQFLGQSFEFKIIKLNKARRNIVVSRRAVLEEERERLRQGIIKELEEGQVREGVVKNITDFGAFIDLGGVDGLLHITDMSWGRVAHPSEMVSIGDRIKVKVLKYERERERISLGLRQLTPHPWEKIDEKYPETTQTQGRVVSITDYGAFVELEEGIEGLVHISDMSWTRRIRQASDVFKKGDLIPVVVTDVDKKRRRISLSHKLSFENPWPKLAEKYAVGTETQGSVSRLLERGLVVSLEGVDGFVPLSQLGIDNLQTPRQSFEIDQGLPLKVIEFDEGQKKIVLSVLEYLKGRDQAEVDSYLELHPIRPVTIGEVVADQDEEMESWGDDGSAPPPAPAAEADSEAEASADVEESGEEEEEEKEE